MNIDIAIVVSFLIITLAVGLLHGQKVKTIRDYALGGRNFSTGALVATIVATFASGSGFFITLSETYSNGFYDSFATLGISVAFPMIALILVPRMEEFLGKISIAEAMGDLYGNNVRLITAIAGTIGSAGLIAVQFKAFGNVVSYFTGISTIVAIIISGAIATVYSAFGGIRAVTFTDILQGLAFGVIIPLLGFAIWGKFYNLDYSLALAINDPKFNLNLLFNTSNKNFWSMFFLFIYFSIPPLSGALFQRISMGNSIQQVKKAFLYSAVIFIIIQFAITWIPFLLHAINPDIEHNNLLSYIVETFSFTGLKGLILVAIIAFSMSTADSMINSSAVLFTHDIYGLFAKNKNNELFVAKLFACILGFSTIILSLTDTDLLGIVVFANSFYFPLVIPPFLLTIFGFRSSSKSVLIGMMVGLIVTFAWKFLPAGSLPVSQNIIGVLFAMLCNTIFLLASHYILRQPGGWVGIKDRAYLDEQKIQKQQDRAEFVDKLKNFSPRKLFSKIAPRSELTYVALGAYFVVYTITTMYTTQIELLGPNSGLMKIVYPSMLVSGTMMMMYPIWPLSIATSIKRAIIETWYPIAVFYMLILFSCFFVLVSKFAMLQVALFVTNMMVAALLLGWRVSLPAIATGFYLGIEFYQHFFGKAGFEAKFGSPEFILMYVVLVLGSIVIFLLKPKQELQEATDAEVGTLKTEVVHLDHEVTNLNSQVNNLNEAAIHYNERISDQEKEIERLGATAQKILNNVNHELRLPVGNVMNFAEMLNEGLGKFDESQLKMLSDEVYKNSNRLSSMIMNMLDLAALNAKKLELDKKTINLGELVTDRVNNCRKVYLEGKKIDFILKIHPEIFVSVDPNYMRQVVDNLVINAIKFSSEGIINVTLLKQKNHIEFIISDSGIGIPQKDIYDIFTPFKMGSNSESKAEGRGVGLALCKAAIEAHGGVITADSKGEKGAIFKFVL